ncbi:MAG: NDP-sugar synthase [Nitriliruptor sp.]|nr:MAG: NDP-sugar synthase [Nitriliruptor sp.]
MIAPVRDAMIVAGGQGTRLRPLTLTTPKPLLPLCGLPFLSGVIRNLAAIGVDRVLLVVGRDPSPFMVLRADAAAFGVTVEAVPEPEPLDTAGGVRAALDQVRGTFLVLNGDILTGLDLAHLVDAHQTSGATATLALTRVEDTSAFGVCVLEGTRIVDFVEKPPPGSLPGQDAVNAGTYVLEPDALARFPLGRLSFERQVFPGLVEAGEMVQGVVSDAVWADLGTPRRLLDGQRMVLDGGIEWPAPSPVLADTDAARRRSDIEVASSAEIRGPVSLLPGTSIAAGATVGPHVVIGSGSRVGRGTSIRDSLLLDGCMIGSDVEVEAALLGHRVVIGDRGRLRGEVVVGDGERVPDDAAPEPGSRLPD